MKSRPRKGSEVTKREKIKRWFSDPENIAGVVVVGAYAAVIGLTAWGVAAAIKSQKNADAYLQAQTALSLAELNKLMSDQQDS